MDLDWGCRVKTFFFFFFFSDLILRRRGHMQLYNREEGNRLGIEIKTEDKCINWQSKEKGGCFVDETTSAKALPCVHTAINLSLRDVNVVKECLKAAFFGKR